MFKAIGLAVLSGLGCRYTQDVGFTCPFVVIDPTDKEAKMVASPGRMIDNFLPIPTQNPCFYSKFIPYGIKASLRVDKFK
jgi:hypothetical protein